MQIQWILRLVTQRPDFSRPIQIESNRNECTPLRDGEEEKNNIWQFSVKIEILNLGQKIEIEWMVLRVWSSINRWNDRLREWMEKELIFADRSEFYKKQKNQIKGKTTVSSLVYYYN